MIQINDKRQLSDFKSNKNSVKSEKYEIEYELLDLLNKKYKKTLSRFLPLISVEFTIDFVVFAFEAKKQDPLFEEKTDQSR